MFDIRTDGESCKMATTKEEEVIISKVEEKQCNNPLAGLANAVNAITNGVIGDESPNMTISTPVNNKQAPPKAMVKPQVLTHVIEGFVIQEGVTFVIAISSLSSYIVYIKFNFHLFLFIFVAASEPFAVSQETTNILNRSNTTTDTHEEPPSK